MVVVPVTSNVPVISVFPAANVPNVALPDKFNDPEPVMFDVEIFATVVLPDTVKSVPIVEAPEVD